jgi:hypothetical protein
MKIYKFLVASVTVTVFILLYVFQQAEIFRLGYGVNKRQEAFQDLLDKNALLRYTVQKNASLTRIGGKLSSCADFQMPESYRLVKVRYSGKTTGMLARPAASNNALVRFFSIKREAQAKTIDR